MILGLGPPGAAVQGRPIFGDTCAAAGATSTGPRPPLAILNFIHRPNYSERGGGLTEEFLANGAGRKAVLCS